jgi:hypothetical protein
MEIKQFWAQDINFLKFVLFVCLLILNIWHLNLYSFGLDFGLGLGISLICVSVWSRFRCIDMYVSVSFSVSVKILVSVDH